LQKTLILLIALCSLWCAASVAPAQEPIASPSSSAETPETRPAFDSVTGLEKIIAQRKAMFKARQQERQKREKAGQTVSEEEKAEKAGTGYLEAYLFYLRQRAYPNDTIDWSAYRRAAEQRSKMPAARWGDRAILGLGANWTFMGPQNLPVPYRIYYGQGTTSGRVNALAFDHSNPGTYYLGAAGGGLWKTTDSGASWTPLGDGWEHLQVNAIAIHPTNSSILYVGTGDFNGFGGLGFGLMKSTDGGATWTNQGKAQFGNFAVSAILIDPEDPNIVTVSTGRLPGWYGKVWRSTDGGANWTAVINTSIPWSDLEYSAKTAGGVRYYYAVGHDTGGELWRSADRGATWTKLNPPTANSYNDGIEVATSLTNPLTVYLISGNDRVVWKSTSKGDDGTWTDITGTLPSGYNWSQSWYDIHLTASTRTSGGSPVDVLYAGLITLFQTPSGDSTWQDIGQTYTNSALTHNDQHSMAVNPNDPNDLLVGNDGGVYRLSYDPALNAWSFDTTLNKKLGLTQFYRMDAHPTDPDRMLGGAQDNASPVSTGDLSNWKNRGGGDGGFCAINPLNPSTQYVTSQYLHIYQTTDGWASGNWWGNNDITPNTGSDRKAFIAPIAIDPNNPHLLYAGTNYLWRFNDNTDSWSARLGGQQLSSSGVVMYIAIAPGDSNRIYTGSDRGEVWMTTDGGTTWKQINSGSPSLPNRSITSIAVDPNNPSRIFVGLSGTGTGHLWRCSDTQAATRVWTNISGSGATGLPDIPLNSVALDLDDPTNTCYVATDVGVFYTTDGGANWANATQPLGLPNVQVNDLKVIAGTRKLYAATYGRGIWRIDLPGSGGGGVTVDAVTLSPNTVAGGASSTGTLTLSSAPASDTTVNLSSSDPAASVPASVIVAAGTTSQNFTVTTTPVATTKTASILASLDGSNKSAALTVHPPVDSVTLNPASVTGGKPSTGRVTLAGPASSDLLISLASSDPAASVPASLLIRAGFISQTFTVNTAPVAADTTATITAAHGGVSRSGTLTVTTPKPLKVTFNPATVTGGARNSVGKITMEDFVAVDTTVNLTITSGGSAVQSMPTTVTVPAGANFAKFTVVTKKVTNLVTVKITTDANGGSATGTLKVRPPVPKSLTFNPNPVQGGSPTTGKVTLDTAPLADVVVTLSIVSGGSAIASLPGSVTVKAGDTSATFAVNTKTVGAATTTKIQAKANNVAKTGSLKVNP